MVRGVSRQIIEVKEFEGDYFERALFFINPDYSDAERKVLEQEARREIRKMGTPTPIRVRTMRRWLWGRLALASLGGAAAAVIVFLAIM